VNIEALKGLAAIQELNLWGTQVASVDALSELTALQSLDISGTQVVSLAPLYALPSLRLRADGIPQEENDRFKEYRSARRLPF
jgi:Leucine-rich repeat (LRR) protein